MIHGCAKCMKIGGILFLLFGILFLLVDFGVWNFFNLSWWTVLFVLIGVISFAQHNCPGCRAAIDHKRK